MSEHTPTTADAPYTPNVVEVRDAWFRHVLANPHLDTDRPGATFNRWLAQERAQAAAQALRDAAKDVQDWYDDTRTYWDWLEARAAGLLKGDDG